MFKVKKNQRGFALIEVLLAALVLTVGAIGYLKLQAIGLNGSRSSFSKNQGVEISKSFVEFLRANTRFRDGTIAKSDLADVFGARATGGNEPLFVVIAHTVSGNQNVAPCDGAGSELACAKQLFLDQKFRIQEAMARSFAPSRAMICAMVNNQDEVEGDENTKLFRRKVRVDFIWRDNTNSIGDARNDLTIDNCPESFLSPVRDKEVKSDVRNYVTIYSEI